MLNSATKRKIDSVRNILVGKVTNPIAQVNEITNALIYKFMNDMDQENLDVDLKSQFFIGDFSRYSWNNLMDKKLSGQERFNLYDEAIKKMAMNKYIPQLFRDIFKNARVPYNDPRVFSLFLKEINEFSYNHSEELGNAFEYLLSIMGSQGDAGMFRTPRHIIDFIVKVIDPKKNETILDPACGTAGFLISAYKHILKAHDGLDNKTGKTTDKEKQLAPEEKVRLMNNISGYDISDEMVKLALVNMYLHGSIEPKIFTYDTLGDEKRWDEQFDVIMANPPFMSPKGGVRPHKRFSIQANRAEVLFVDYIMEHLSLKGRAGIIVPEGIITKPDKAYKALRKKLVEDGLFAVASLPAGVFHPYAGVKTSILFFDNQVAKKTDEILFVKIENDGFDLGAQRRPIERNDLPEALKIIREFQKNAKRDVNNICKILKIPKPQKLGEMKWGEDVWSTTPLFDIVSKKKIAKDGDYNLTSERYREIEILKNQKWEMVKLGEVLEYEQPTKYIVESVNYDNSFKTPVLTAGKTFILGYTNEKEGLMPTNKLPVIIFDDFTTAIKFVDFPFKVKSSAMKILHTDRKKADTRFLFQLMKTIKFRHDIHKRYWISEFSKIKIPLPPIEVQKEIVEQIEVKQNAIDHAKAIIQNLERERRYFGQALKKLERVEIVELGEIVKTITPPIKIKKSEFNKKGEFPIIDQSQEFIAGWTDNINSLVKTQKPLVIFGDHTCVIKLIEQDFVQGADGIKILETKERLSPKFLYYYLQANNVEDGEYKRHFTKLKKLKIPLPSLKIQKQLVAEAKKEEKIITANKKLIKIMEKKIKEVIVEI